MNSGKIELAKVILKKAFNDPLFANKRIKVKAFYASFKEYRIAKAEWKQARKEIGAVSENIDGVQYWRLED